MEINKRVIAIAKEKNPLVRAIRHYTKLIEGKELYIGECPICKTGKLLIPKGQEVYQCVCSSGDVFEFMSRINNWSLTETLNEFGLELPKKDHSYTELHDVYERACSFFERELRKDEDALAYFKSRQFPKYTAHNYRIGYAPNNMSLYEELKKEFSDEVLADSGLFTVKDGKFYNKFFKRLMIPIINRDGNVIAFGGRVIEAAEKCKYLNSPKTPIFDKGEVLFGEQKLGKNEPCVVICEGYFDAIAYQNNGFTNTVATLGTALTKTHAYMLAKITDRIILAYDNDAAGQKATIKAINILKSVKDFEILVVKTDDCKDADEYFKEHLADDFLQEIKKAVPGTLYLIEELSTKYDMTSIKDLAEFSLKIVDLNPEEYLWETIEEKYNVPITELMRKSC